MALRIRIQTRQNEYGHGIFEITDVMRREALRIRPTGRVSAVSINGLILPPEEDCLSGKEMSLDDVSSEGPTTLEYGYGC